MDIQQLTGRVDPLVQHSEKNKTQQNPHQAENKFASVLDEVRRLRFSGHAQKRIDQRSLQMSKVDINRLEEAVNRAAEKGGRDTLVLDGESAYLVNVPNRTVVTAMDMVELREKVFTNIDSTIITKQF
ncbi:MAG: TIGR02530 family flagellar biosynthesis protein [Balneolaceae bacterium]